MSAELCASLDEVMLVIAVYGGWLRVGEIGVPIPASEVPMAPGESQKHTIFEESFSLEAFLDWLAPIVVVIVIGGMIFALVGAMLAQVE